MLEYNIITIRKLLVGCRDPFTRSVKKSAKRILTSKTDSISGLFH